MNDKKKICFIVNPISGVGKQKIIESAVEKHLNKTMFDYKIKYTKAAKHAIEISKQLAKDNYDIVVAVGGDGSVNEVSKGLAFTNTTLAIIPTGSGNGLARHFRIPMNISKAIQVINKINTITIDTINLNEELFVNVAGVGFDALICERFASYGKRGLSSYLKIIFNEFFKYKNLNYELDIKGKKKVVSAFLISFANGTQWGNNAKIAPAADVTDGSMQVVVIRKVNCLNVPFVALRLLSGKIRTSKYSETIITKEIVLKQQNTFAHIDGELIDSGNTLSLKVNPLSLKILIP